MNHYNCREIDGTTIYTRRRPPHPLAPSPADLVTIAIVAAIAAVAAGALRALIWG